MEGLIIESPSFGAPEQMAADELLCDALPSPYILRFYNWRESGITFGYSQRITQVREAAAARRPPIKALVRRPTGGGIVFHESDLTFSFIFRQPGVYFEPRRTYGRLHRAIAGAYTQAGIGFELAGGGIPDYAVNGPAMDCFAKPVNLDILYNGKKVLGGALRKFGDHTLYQASFQAPDSGTNAGFHRDMVTRALAAEFGLSWRKRGISAAELEKAGNLVVLKYGAKEWNERI